jgi:hypothetical protein
MHQFRVLVWAAMCVIVHLEVAAASISAHTKSSTLDRADFANRIWLADFATVANWPGKLSTLQLSGDNSDEIYDYLKGCVEPRTCGRSVLVAGMGYMKGYTGTKDTVELTSPTSKTVHIGLLHSLELHESLTDSVLAVFRPTEVTPACYAAAKVPGKKEDFYYGRWSIKSVQLLRNGNYLAWVVDGGGDGGYEWSLQRFLEIEPTCKLAQKQDYLVSWGPRDGCQRQIGPPHSFFSVLETGAIGVRMPKKDCNAVKLTRLPSNSP